MGVGLGFAILCSCHVKTNYIFTKKIKLHFVVINLSYGLYGLEAAAMDRDSYKKLTLFS